MTRGIRGSERVRQSDAVRAHASLYGEIDEIDIIFGLEDKIVVRC